jgi:hypothetical protein
MSGQRGHSTPPVEAVTAVADLLVPAVIPAANRRADPASDVRLRRPLPLPAAPPDWSVDGVVYGMGRLDPSGRISEITVTTALGWHAADHLAYRPLPRTVEIRRDPTGLATLSPRGLLPIPAAVRNRYGLEPGDRVLLAATPATDQLTLYPLATLRDALAALDNGGETS